MKTTLIDGVTWVSDERGNKCSVDYFGTIERATEALASLVDCDDCVNCSRCSRCSRCSGCSGCSDCSDCYDCSGCSDCSDCYDCSGCSGCSGCSELENATPISAGRLAAPIPQVPVIPDIHKAVLAAVSQPEALDMGTWHCGTVHCRAGWVVTLAGDAGKALEKFFNTELAAMKIYEASGYKINPCRFYDTNEAAMEDMRKLAEAAR